MSVQVMPQPWNIGSEPVQIKQIIITQLRSVGDGTEDNPYRTATEFWDMDGNCIASFDKWSPEPKVTVTTATSSDNKPNKTKRER